jgi:hypothetical protein
MSTPVESSVFDRVGNDVVTSLCKRHHFQPTDPPAERHGSWEWTFRKHDGALDRFVSLAFTSLPPAVPDADWYTAEVWAGAEANDRYARKLVSSFRASLQDEHAEQLRAALKEPLERAMSIAKAFTARDCDEAYIRPRSPA